jgi:tRNA(fMet)-specific endonuclease VapC
VAELIDSGIIIALERRGLSVDALVPPVPDELVALASITASELLIGVHRADTLQRRRDREAFVEAVLQRLPILPFDLEVARRHARLWAELAAAGQMIGAHDLIIAATALTHDCAVLTENVRDFERVPGLEVRRPAW